MERLYSEEESREACRLLGSLGEIWRKDIQIIFMDLPHKGQKGVTHSRSDLFFSSLPGLDILGLGVHCMLISSALILWADTPY